MSNEPGAPMDLAERAARMPAMVSYQELLKMNDRLARIDAKLDLAVALQGKVDNLDRRVQEVEKTIVGINSRSGQWSKVMDMLWGLLLAFIAAGVWLRP